MAFFGPTADRVIYNTATCNFFITGVLLICIQQQQLPTIAFYQSVCKHVA